MTPRAYRNLNRVLLLSAAGLLAAPFGIMGAGQHLPRWVTACQSLQIFGRPCPMCGLTRAMVALGSGDWAGASRLSVLVWPVALLLVTEIACRTWLSARVLPPSTVRRVAAADAAAHALVLLSYWAYAAGFYAGILAA